jgi:hypothetical protein
MPPGFTGSTPTRQADGRCAETRGLSSGSALILPSVPAPSSLVIFCIVQYIDHASNEFDLRCEPVLKFSSMD